jgi:hypothetical protein
MARPRKRSKKMQATEAAPPETAPKRPKKRRGVPLHVYIDPELREVLDAVVEESEPHTGQKAVVELALRRYFTSLGRWPRPAPPPP